MAQKQEIKRYTAAERKAYYMGLGAYIGLGKVANIKKTAGKMTAAEKRSFYNGFDDGALKRKK